MNDETLMAEELGSLRQKNKELKETVGDRNSTINTLRWQIARGKFFYSALGALVGLSMVLGLGYLLFKWLNSYETKHCYIERGQSTVQVYRVKRTVEWEKDRGLGFSTDLDKAMEIAQKQGCKIHRSAEE